MTEEQQLAELLGKGGSSFLSTPAGRAMLALYKVEQAFHSSYPYLSDALNDKDDPALSLQVSRRPDGAWLAIVKRQHGTQEQVIMSYGDTPLESFLKLDTKVGDDRWKKNKTWAERQKEMAEAEKSKKK